MESENVLCHSIADNFSKCAIRLIHTLVTHFINSRIKVQQQTDSQHHSTDGAATAGHSKVREDDTLDIGVSSSPAGAAAWMLMDVSI